MAIINVAAAIIFYNNTILLSQRKANTSYAGKWEFPGGKLELNENFTQALQRELYEELNLNIKAQELKFFYHTKFLTDSRLIINIKFYLCKIYNKINKGKEQQKLKYVLVEDLKNLEFPPADIEVVQKLITADFNFFTNTIN